MLSRFHFFASNSPSIQARASRFLSTIAGVQDSPKQPSLTDLFTPYKVKNIGGTSANGVQYSANISFKLYLTFPREKLPYACFYTEEYLKEEELIRENTTIVLARADNRTPKEIWARGGFHPQATNSYSCQKYGEDILDVISHRNLAWGSGLVSLTHSMEVAINLPLTTYVYLIKAVGAISPHPKFFANECEWSIPGGVDFGDVIAFRSSQGYTFNNSPIFISKDFEQRYPEKLSSAIKAYLSTNEACEVNEVEISHSTEKTIPRIRF